MLEITNEEYEKLRRALKDQEVDPPAGIRIAFPEESLLWVSPSHFDHPVTIEDTHCNLTIAMANVGSKELSITSLHVTAGDDPVELMMHQPFPQRMRWEDGVFTLKCYLFRPDCGAGLFNGFLSITTDPEVCNLSVPLELAVCAPMGRGRISVFPDTLVIPELTAEPGEICYKSGKFIVFNDSGDSWNCRAGCESEWLEVRPSDFELKPGQVLTMAVMVNMQRCDAGERPNISIECLKKNQAHQVEHLSIIVVI